MIYIELKKNLSMIEIRQSPHFLMVFKWKFILEIILILKILMFEWLVTSSVNSPETEN